MDEFDAFEAGFNAGVFAEHTWNEATEPPSYEEMDKAVVDAFNMWDTEKG